MMKINRYCCALLPVFTILTVVSIKAQHASAAYQKSIDDWHTARIAALKADNGWLNLAGLFWLQQGKNTFGSDSSNAVVFPKGSINGVAGYFERAGNTVRLVAANNAGITINGVPVTDTIIFSDTMQQVPVIACGSLRWNIIQRENKTGVRLRDLNSPAPAMFKGVDCFEVDSNWRFGAILQQPALPSVISISNVIGQTTRQNSPGKVVFVFKGKQYYLDALDDGEDLLVVFGDATSGVTTYPSGRFIDVKKPGADGMVVLDFNKAYNPPCAFTDYATCPLPPPQNILPFAVAAGEKNYGDHHK
jgi:uncharacterized protein (DUF1684 family)